MVKKIKKLGQRLHYVFACATILNIEGHKPFGAKNKYKPYEFDNSQKIYSELTLAFETKQNL